MRRLRAFLRRLRPAPLRVCLEHSQGLIHSPPCDVCLARARDPDWYKLSTK